MLEAPATYPALPHRGRPGLGLRIMTSPASLHAVPRTSSRDAVAVAQKVAAELETTAVERDRRGGTAKHERDLLRQSGLLGLAIPQQYGGWGASWAEVMAAVRTIARADGSLAHVFGFQHLMLGGEPAQRLGVVAELFWGDPGPGRGERDRVATRVQQPSGGKDGV